MRNLIIIALIALTGCAGMQIDTIEKQVASFDATYRNVLRQVILYRNEGRFNADEWKRIQNAVSKVETARTAALEALRIGNGKGAQDSLTLALSALDVLRSYLKTEQVNIGGPIWPTLALD